MEKGRYVIRRANPEDVKSLVYVMKEASRTVEKAEWFVSDDEAFIREHIEKKGFTLVAVPEEEERRVVGFLIIKFPGLSEENLGRLLEYPEEKLMQVAHMDSAAVLPEARGRKLQSLFLQQAERELAGTQYRYFMATVHPDNRYSLQNLLGCGYRVIKTVRKYGGLLRHLLLKEIGEEM